MREVVGLSGVDHLRANLIPGVHVAIHTHAGILHTAAWMDFADYVHWLLRDGRTTLARQLGGPVVEVIHNRTNPAIEVR